MKYDRMTDIPTLTGSRAAQVLVRVGVRVAGGSKKQTLTRIFLLLFSESNDAVVTDSAADFVLLRMNRIVSQVW